MSDYKRPQKGVSIDREDSDNAPAPAGLWRHPQTGQEVATLSHPLYGDAQSEGFRRAGFERVGDVPEGYIKTVVDPSTDYAEKPERCAEAIDAYNKGFEARLNALESENATLREKLTVGTDEVVP